MPELTPQRRRAIIIAVAAVAFIAKLLLALKTYGTNDVYTYERFGLWSRYLGVDLYKIAPDLNHPPSMLHFLSGIIWLSGFTHLPFHFWLRFCGIAADAGSLWLICRMLGERLAERSVFTAVILIAIAPMHILISGFHGNTDPVMIFFVMLAVWLTGYRDKVAAGGAAFGMAFCIKIAPVIAAPVLFFSLPTFRKRILFFAAAALVVLIGWAPYFFDDPRAVISQVFGYKSSYGLWGVSWLLRKLAVAWPAFGRINLLYSQIGSPLVLFAVTVLSYAMSRLRNKPSLYTRMGMVFLFFFAFTSGFAVQYLAWLTPWIAELGAIPVALFIVSGSVFLLVVYNYWTLGMPWYLAIAYPWNTHQYFQVICWASVVLLTIAAWWQVRHRHDFTIPFPQRVPAALGWSSAGIALAAGLIYPAIVHMRRDRLTVSPVYGEDDALYTEADVYHNLAIQLFQRGRKADSDAIENQAVAIYTRAGTVAMQLTRNQPARSTLVKPEDLVDASLNDYNNGDFAQCVYDATESLKLRGGMPAAWNNIAVCNAELGRWDDAVAAATEDFRLEPESDVVQQNLAWAIAERQRAHLSR